MCDKDYKNYEAMGYWATNVCGTRLEELWYWHWCVAENGRLKSGEFQTFLVLF